MFERRSFDLPRRLAVRFQKQIDEQPLNRLGLVPDLVVARGALPETRSEDALATQGESIYSLEPVEVNRCPAQQAGAFVLRIACADALERVPQDRVRA